jgi:hypothetical protein
MFEDYRVKNFPTPVTLKDDHWNYIKGRVIAHSNWNPGCNSSLQPTRVEAVARTW